MYKLLLIWVIIIYVSCNDTPLVVTIPPKQIPLPIGKCIDTVELTYSIDSSSLVYSDKQALMITDTSNGDCVLLGYRVKNNTVSLDTNQFVQIWNICSQRFKEGLKSPDLIK